MNRKHLISSALAATVATAVLASAPAAHAGERTCRGALGATTVDDLRVPQGVKCTLNGTRVKGTITVQPGGTLVANGVRVIGNVQAEGARDVVVRRASQVGGSVQVKQGGSASVLGSRIVGDVQLDANARLLRVNDNVVGGSVQVVGNDGGVRVFRNVVDGNLECKENRPRPSGGANRVEGSREDQCARFCSVRGWVGLRSGPHPAPRRCGAGLP